MAAATACGSGGPDVIVKVLEVSERVRNVFSVVVLTIVHTSDGCPLDALLAVLQSGSVLVACCSQPRISKNIIYQLPKSLKTTTNTTSDGDGSKFPPPPTFLAFLATTMPELELDEPFTR